MTSEHKNPGGMSEHEKKNEGGRGHVHEPSQSQQASKNQGLADKRETGRQQSSSGSHQSGSGSESHMSSQQTGSGSHSGSSQQGTHQGSGSQQGSQQNRPPGSTSQEQKKQEQKKAAIGFISDFGVLRPVPPFGESIVLSESMSSP